MRFVGVASAGRALRGALRPCDGRCCCVTPPAAPSPPAGSCDPARGSGAVGGAGIGRCWVREARRCWEAAATAEIAQRRRCGSGTLRSLPSCGAVITKLWVRAPSLLVSL